MDKVVGQSFDGPAPLQAYRSQYHLKTCKWCKTLLTGQPQCWEHPGGFEVQGFANKQWVYTECPGCDYQWAMHKLGISQLMNVYTGEDVKV